VLASTDLEAARTMGHSLVEQNPWAGYTSLGLIEYFAGDGLAASLGWYLRAYGQDPHDELSNRALIQILSQAGLFEEARRISDGNLHIVDVAENRLESAIYSLQLAHTGDPENLALLTDLADALHLAGRFDESQRYYDQLRHRSPLNAVFDTVYASTMPTVRMAYAFKLAGDTEAARQALAIHRLDVEKRQKLKTTAFSDHLAEAAARSVEDNASGVFESIQAAIDAGARDQAFFREPALQWLQGHPEFLALKAQMQQRVDTERAGIVRLICQQNPIPEIWQPLRQTCDGIEAGS